MLGDVIRFLVDPSRGWPFVLPLLTAHLLADFPLQPGQWVAHRNERGWASPYLYLHASISALVAYAAACASLATLSAWWLLPLVFLSHLLIDGFKALLAIARFRLMD